MTPEIEELTTDLDRAAGQRRITVTDGDERMQMLLLFESNTGLPDDLPRWEPVAHPPLNKRLAELLMDALCALHGRKFSVSLSDS